MAARPVQLALAAALLLFCALARGQVEEAPLKAAFVYNFALYTTWPMPMRDAATVTVCVRSASALVPALRALAGKPVQARALAVREIDGPGAVSGCDMLLVGPEDPAVSSAGLLTVCDCGASEARGAVIALVREGDRLRFDVDLGAASASKLSLSSKLLRLARTTR